MQFERRDRMSWGNSEYDRYGLEPYDDTLVAACKPLPASAPVQTTANITIFNFNPSSFSCRPYLWERPFGSSADRILGHVFPQQICKGRGDKQADLRARLRDPHVFVL